MPFKGLINKASNKIKSALENSDTFSKVVSAKKKLKLAGIIAGAVGVLATIFIIISVISYFLGLVQEILLDYKTFSFYPLIKKRLFPVLFYFFGVPMRTRTTIGRLGGDCSILLSYRNISTTIVIIAILI